jgi:hypothetical protein
MIGHIDHTHSGGGKIKCDHWPNGWVGFKWNDCVDIDSSTVGHGTKVEFGVCNVSGRDIAVKVRRSK